MSREEQIQAIIKVLNDSEHDLSDGYDFYCGFEENDVLETLREIAEKILDSIK